MDGNLQHLRPTVPLDREDQNTGTSLDMSGITGNNSRDLVERDEEIVSTGNQMGESLSTEWTDEKHRLYLSSMEASFVKQLYNLEYRSMNMLDWRSRGSNKLDPNTSRQLNANARTSSGQFKVLRGGCWKQINFERPQPQVDIVDETDALPENQWIQRFRSGRRHREVTSPKLEEHGPPCTEAVYLAGHKTATAGVATSSKRFSDCHSHLYHQDSAGSSTEVSDQNFPNEDHEGEQLSSLCRAKRMKTTSVDDSAKDQVVPLGKAPVMEDTNENCASPGAGEAQSERMDGFGCLGSGSSYFADQELSEGVCKGEELKL